jgi:23S rRNA (guanosine2251-2'-O)-methyltransferase
VEVEGGTLTAVAGFDGHQGIALVVDARRWSDAGEILALAAERAEPPLVLVLDSLEDPQNLGTLLRSAEASGVHGAVFPTRRQAPLSPAAIKASAGAVEHLRLAPVDDLPGALADLHARGLRIVGADGDAPLTARDADLRGPIAIVVGSEGKGLGAAVRRRCDLLVRIPMHGRIESLNAAVAGSILLYEAAAQRRLPESPRQRSAEVESVAPSTDPVPDPSPAPQPSEAPGAAIAGADAEAPTPPASPAPRRRAPRKNATPAPAHATHATTTEPPTPKRRAPRPKADPKASDTLSSGESLLPGEPAAAPATDLPEAPADPPSGPSEV